MIIRTYACNDCGTLFEFECSSNDPDPDCPECSKVLQWRPQSFNIGGSTEGKAVKMAQDIMEQDYGLSNFKDNSREGDVGYIDPTKKTAAQQDAIGQRESEAGREVVKRLAEVAPEHKTNVDNFFGGQSSAIGQNRIPAQTLIANAKALSGKTTGGGVDAMAGLHKLGKEGKLPVGPSTVYRAD